MTLVRVPDKDIKEVAVECKCGAVIHLQMGERARCECGKEYYCDASFHIWQNVVRFARTSEA